MSGFHSWTSWLGVHYVPDGADGSGSLIICHADALPSLIPIYCAIIVRSLNKECRPRRQHVNNRLFLLFRKGHPQKLPHCLSFIVTLRKQIDEPAVVRFYWSLFQTPEPGIAILCTAKTGHSLSLEKKAATARPDEITCMIAMNIFRLQHLPANYRFREKQSEWRDSQKIPKLIVQPWFDKAKCFVGEKYSFFFSSTWGSYFFF